MSALEVAAEVSPRLLVGLRPHRPVSLAEHVSRYGALPPAPRASLRGRLEASGLRGRGGGNFPVGAKLLAVAASSGRPSVLVNATEGEPLSQKDKLLVRHLPHLVLDGAVALAADLGARDVVVAVAGSARAERAIVSAAIADRASHKLDGRVRIEVVPVPDTFIAGEETALVAFLNGGDAKPTFTPPRVFERGLDGRPTLVQNAETVANVALIARHGGEWFRELGTHDDPGSALFTLAGAVRRPGVYEASLGVSLPELVALGGGPSQTPQAVLVGGYFGSWIDAAGAAAVRLDEASMQRRGSGLGARVVSVLPESECGVAETTRIVRYLAGESAGQCGPCVNGLAAIARTLETCVRGGDERERITRWSDQVVGRGACRHPDGAVRLVRSALEVFSSDFAAHAQRRCVRRR